MPHTVRSIATGAVLSLALTACAADEKRPADPPMMPAAATEAENPRARASEPSSTTEPMLPGEAEYEADATPMPGSTTEQPRLEPAPTAPSGEPPLSDAQIVAITDAASSAELEQSRYALRKARTTSVKKFAQMMVTDHQRVAKEQEQLLKKIELEPAQSSDSTQLTTEAFNTLQALRNTSAADFDRAYMDAQVEAHRALLATLDKQLIPNAHDSQLEALLRRFRTRVAEHLDQAEKTRDSLPAATGPGAKHGDHP